jgi:hypothetical protein
LLALSVGTVRMSRSRTHKHAALVTGFVSAGLIENPELVAAMPTISGRGSSPMSKMPRPNMPTVPNNVMAGTAADPYRRLLGERPGRRNASLRRPGRREAASVEIGAHSHTHRQLDLLPEHADGPDKTRNASGPVPVLVRSYSKALAIWHSYSKALAIWHSPALGTPTQPFRSTRRRVWSASLRSPDHSIADDHVPALPPPRERWPKTGPHVSDDYPAGRQQPVVFPRVAVDNMEGSRVAIIGFEDLTYRYPEKFG